MQFDETQTYCNLAKSFAGECQAGMRYQLAAKLAEKEGYQRLSDLIKNIAKNETAHATVFFTFLQKYKGNTDNIDIEAGYPYHLGTLEESLLFAANDEKNEQTIIYPSFSSVAKEEGFEDISAAFQAISVIEGNHHILFSYLHDALQNGTLYKSEQPMLWICSECGYMHTSKEAHKVCPVCKKGQGYVELHLPFDYFGKNGITAELVKDKV